MTKNNNIMIFGLFVDDITTFYNDVDEKEYNICIELLKTKYEMSDLGDLHHILLLSIFIPSGIDIYMFSLTLAFRNAVLTSSCFMCMCFDNVDSDNITLSVLYFNTGANVSL